MEEPLWHHKFWDEEIALLGKLNEAGVAYIIIGGAAVAHYGGREAQEIDDLDILVDCTEENAGRFAKVIDRATKEAGVHLTSQVVQSDFARPKIQWPLKTAQFHCEFLTPNSHDEFDEFLSNADKTVIRGQSVHIMARSDLIVMKRNCVEDYRKVLAKHVKDLKYLEGP
jgi:predicted nucleotidyltransferase